MPNIKVLTVDPGVYTLGACVWDAELWSKKKAFPTHIMNHVINDHERHGITPNWGMNFLIGKLKKWFEKFEIEACHCEKPQLFSSARGHATAIKGHLLQLEMFRGMLFMVCGDYSVPFFDVPVLQWKGQLSKLLVMERIKDIYVKHGKREDLMKLTPNMLNDWDACGIGLYLQEMFK